MYDVNLVSFCSNTSKMLGNKLFVAAIVLYMIKKTLIGGLNCTFRREGRRKKKESDMGVSNMIYYFLFYFIFNWDESLCSL